MKSKRTKTHPVPSWFFFFFILHTSLFLLKSLWFASRAECAWTTAGRWYPVHRGWRRESFVEEEQQLLWGRCDEGDAPLVQSECEWENKRDGRLVVLDSGQWGRRRRRNSSRACCRRDLGRATGRVVRDSTAPIREWSFLVGVADARVGIAVIGTRNRLL